MDETQEAPEGEEGPLPLPSTARRRLLEEVASALKSRGYLPGGLSREFDIEEGKTPWQALLRAQAGRLIAQQRGDGYPTYAVMHRRAAVYARLGVVYPGTRRVWPLVALVVDTSGSISRQELSRFVGR